MEAKLDINFFRQLAQFRRAGSNVYPDEFNEIAQDLYGLDIKEAQSLYFFYRELSVGKWARDKNDDEILERLQKAQDIVDKCLSIKRSADGFESIESYLGNGRYSQKNRIGVYARHGDRLLLHELSITDPETYRIIDEMQRAEGIRIVCFVPLVDSICNCVRNGCDNEMEGRDTMDVYDGDLFVLYNHEEDNYWNRPGENGVYLCEDGAYRKLLYTVGRGYINGKKDPNIADDGDEDNDSVFMYESGRFNHHLLTLNHRWKRIGNIHADISILRQQQ